MARDAASRPVDRTAPAGNERVRQVISGMFAAIDARDWALLPRYFADASRYDRTGYAPIDGLVDLVRFYAHERVIAERRHRIDRLVVDGREAVALGSFEGLLKDGRAVELTFADAYTVDGDRVVRRTTYFHTPLV